MNLPERRRLAATGRSWLPAAVLGTVLCAVIVAGSLFLPPRRTGGPAPGAAGAGASPTPSATGFPSVDATVSPTPPIVSRAPYPSVPPPGAATVRPAPASPPVESTGIPRPSPARSARVGQVYRHVLYTHCGIEFTHFDGMWWRTKPLNDGSGNPPDGWGNPHQSGTIRLLDERTAEFRGDNGRRLLFAPAPDAEPGLCM